VAAEPHARHYRRAHGGERGRQPHVYSVYKIDMTRIVRLRERERTRFEQKHGVKLTSCVHCAAAVEALRRHPIVNASLKDGAIYYTEHQLGHRRCARVGLIVPVVKQAETLSFVQLAQSMADLAERAPQEAEARRGDGSTFTLTNAGVFGASWTPSSTSPSRPSWPSVV